MGEVERWTIPICERCGTGGEQDCICPPGVDAYDTETVVVRYSGYEELEAEFDEATQELAIELIEARTEASKAEAERDQAQADKAAELEKLAEEFDRWVRQQEKLEPESTDLQGVALLRDAYRSVAAHLRKRAEEIRGGDDA